MEIMAAPWTAVLLFVLRITHISAKDVPKYFIPDETLHFRPLAVPGPITSILWRHDGNYVAEWIKDQLEKTYYAGFNDRTEMDTNTGELKIRQATKADSGVFTVEINDKVQADRYIARMMLPVTDRIVWVKPGPTPNTYLLYCDPVHGQEADLGEDAEFISYRWKIITDDWVEFGNKLQINVNETTRNVETFTCQMVNPVSNKTSKAVKNPFYGQDPHPGPSPGVIAAVCVGLGGLIGGCYCAFAYKKNKFPFHRNGTAPVSPGDKEHEREEFNTEP